MYGFNIYFKKVIKGFWFFVWDVCKDMMFNIFMVCVVVFFVMGIWIEGIKKGWYEGISIGVVVFFVIVVIVVSDYK